MSKLGDVKRAERGPAAALPLYLESIEIARRNVGRNCETPQTLRDVAIAEHRIAIAVRQRAKDSAAALAHVEEAVRLFEAAHARWPSRQSPKDVKTAVKLRERLRGDGPRLETS